MYYFWTCYLFRNICQFVPLHKDTLRAGAKYRGEFEGCFEAVLSKVKNMVQPVVLSIG